MNEGGKWKYPKVIYKSSSYPNNHKKRIIWHYAQIRNWQIKGIFHSFQCHYISFSCKWGKLCKTVWFLLGFSRKFSTLSLKCRIWFILFYFQSSTSAEFHKLIIVLIGKSTKISFNTRINSSSMILTNIGLYVWYDCCQFCPSDVNMISKTKHRFSIN